MSIHFSCPGNTRSRQNVSKESTYLHRGDPVIGSTQEPHLQYSTIPYQNHVTQRVSEPSRLIQPITAFAHAPQDLVSRVNAFGREVNNSYPCNVYFGRHSGLTQRLASVCCVFSCKVSYSDIQFFYSLQQVLEHGIDSLTFIPLLLQWPTTTLQLSSSTTTGPFRSAARVGAA